MSSRLDQITDWRDRSERAGYRVGILAEQAGVTERQLRRYFRAKFGHSPHFWMTSNRLNIVRQLLATGRLVKEAAFTAGFRQQGNLTRQFKKYYKVSPRSLHDL